MPVHPPRPVIISTIEYLVDYLVLSLLLQVHAPFHVLHWSSMTSNLARKLLANRPPKTHNLKQKSAVLQRLLVPSPERWAKVLLNELNAKGWMQERGKFLKVGRPHYSYIKGFDASDTVMNLARCAYTRLVQSHELHAPAPAWELVWNVEMSRSSHIVLRMKWIQIKTVRYPNLPNLQLKYPNHHTLWNVYCIDHSVQTQLEISVHFIPSLSQTLQHLCPVHLFLLQFFQDHSGVS